MGLLTANLDSPLQSAWTNTKQQNARTELGCQACRVKRADLGNPNFDVKKAARSADGLRKDLAFVSAGATPLERTKRSKRKGVVLGRYFSPLGWLVYDPISQTGFDILHQAS